MSLRSGNQLSWLGLAVLACALVWSSTRPAMGGQGQQGETSEAPSGIVLLESGRILHGTAVRQGDVFVVQLLSGEIRVPRDEVRLVCDSLDEAYYIQRRRLPSADPDAHVALARWCLSCGLSGYAQAELRAALALDPNHRDAEVMLRRISKKSVTNATAPPFGAPVGEDSNVASPASTPLREVAPAPRSFRRPSPQRADDEKTPHDAPPVPHDLPRLARRAFTVAIEPVLFESCALSGCHGRRATNPLQLELPLRTRRAERSASVANFRTVLKYVDLKHPAESPILLVPMRHHGRSKRPVFSGPDDLGYRKLSAWVFAISSPADSPEPANAPNQTTGATADSPADAATPIKELPPKVRQQIQQFTIPPIGVSPEDHSEERDPYDPKTEDGRFLKKLIKALGLRKK